jgi:hypothetical protein
MSKSSYVSRVACGRAAAATGRLTRRAWPALSAGPLLALLYWMLAVIFGFTTLGLWLLPSNA